MRPYLAILKDSFREAIASRVLLVTLVGIVVVLLLLAPFGLNTETATELRRSELTRPERLLQKLEAGADEQNTPAAHLWSLLEEDQQERIRKLLDPGAESNSDPGPGPDGRRIKREIVNRLNKLLEHEEFYSAEVWDSVTGSDELQKLIDEPALSNEQQKRRNLLLLAAAFPREIEIVDSNAMSLTYGTATVQGPIPLTPSQIEPIVDSVLMLVVGIFLGFFGVFGCLLVTAGVVPRTFEPGEISLLLSKPVNRSLLFVVKFVGGCSFTLLYAAVLVVGIWFLLGTRMGFWRPELLWCIPVYVFLFMIYYAVSAVAGAIWRNSIVALALVVVFWLGLTVVGVTQEALKQNLIRERGVKEVVAAGEHVLTVDGEQNTYLWESETSEWKEVFRSTPGAMDRFTRMFLASGIRFAPVYDRKNDRILALEQSRSRFSGLGAPQLVAGSEEDDWERIPLGRVPEFTPAVLVDADGRIILPARGAIYEFVGQSEEERRRADFLGNITGGLFGGASEAFRKVHPDDLPDFGENLAAAIDVASSDLILYGDGKLAHLSASEDGRYDITTTRDFESDEAGVVACSSDFVILGMGNGRILAMRTETLDTVAEIQLPDAVLPRTCAAAPDGSTLALLTHDKTVVLFDCASQELRLWSRSVTGDCSALAFNAESQMLVGDGRLGVLNLNITGDQVTREELYAEPTSWVYQFYDYAVLPLYSVLPKPSQLDEFVSYILSGEKTVILNERAGPPGFVNRDSLQQAREVFDPFTVLRDNVIFVVVMLAIGCLYVSRSDF